MKDGKLAGPPEQHFDRSHAAPACVTPGMGQSVPLSTRWLFSARTGAGEGGAGGLACSDSLPPENPFTLNV